MHWQDLFFLVLGAALREAFDRYISREERRKNSRYLSEIAENTRPANRIL